VLDVARLRKETPGCAEVIHFNNAGASLMPGVVLETVKGHLDLEARIGGYEAARQVETQLDAVYTSLATLINARPHEIAVVENATRAWDMAFYSLPFKPGERILTSQAEYASNFIAYLQVARRTGVKVETIPNDDNGQLDLAALERMMDERVRLISITHIPTNGGLVNPAAEVGRVAKAWNVLYLLDACQSVGQLPVDVQTIGCDLLSATSRKYLRGPRGMGFLYVRGEILENLEPPFLDLHAATWTSPYSYDLEPSAKRFENWECNVAAKLGFGRAVDYALEQGVEETWPYLRDLAGRFRQALAEVPGVNVHDLGETRCGIVSFTLEGTRPDTLRDLLKGHRINVNVSRAPSTLLDMSARGLSEVVRASLHYYNSDEEIARFTKALHAHQTVGV
jgi:cysteine desulfurase / selenocysteine lyase